MHGGSVYSQGSTHLATLLEAFEAGGCPPPIGQARYPISGQPVYAGSMFQWDGISGTLSGVRVLVVDDDLDTLDVYCCVLELAGAIVKCVDGGPAALAAIETFQPHVLLSDIAMPGMTGLELIRAIRKRADEYARLPAIAFTAHAQGGTLTEATTEGFDQAMTKPVLPPQLVGAIRGVVGFP
jgi:CheY-like chemotaxis protein